MTGLCPDVNRAAHPGPIPGLPKLVSEEKSRSWGLMSVGVFRRAPGEMVWSSDYHRISYVLTDICGTKQSDDGSIEEYRLQRGDIALRPRGRALRPEPSDIDIPPGDGGDTWPIPRRAGVSRPVTTIPCG